jgi:hypothetical protein
VTCFPFYLTNGLVANVATSKYEVLTIVSNKLKQELLVGTGVGNALERYGDLAHGVNV